MDSADRTAKTRILPVADRLSEARPMIRGLAKVLDKHDTELCLTALCLMLSSTILSSTMFKVKQKDALLEIVLNTLTALNEVNKKVAKRTLQ